MRKIFGIVVAMVAMIVPVQAQLDPWGQTVEALVTALEIEQVLQDDDLERFRSLERRRAEGARQVARLQQSVEALLIEPGDVDPDRLQRLIDQVDSTARQASGLLDAQRNVLERIVGRAREMKYLEARLDELRSRPDDAVERGPLAGTWEMTLMPIGLRGTAELDQTGAVIAGTYRFEGGWTGSLQGTLVNRKVLLVRIDSKLGKSMELEGFLSSDGRSIRGSWLNFELAGSEGGSGEWAARRRGGAP